MSTNAGHSTESISPSLLVSASLRVEIPALSALRVDEPLHLQGVGDHVAVGVRLCRHRCPACRAPGRRSGRRRRCRDRRSRASTCTRRGRSRRRCPCRPCRTDRTDPAWASGWVSAATGAGEFAGSATTDVSLKTFRWRGGAGRAAQRNDACPDLRRSSIRLGQRVLMGVPGRRQGVGGGLSAACLCSTFSGIDRLAVGSQAQQVLRTGGLALEEGHRPLALHQRHDHHREDHRDHHRCIEAPRTPAGQQQRHGPQAAGQRAARAAGLRSALDRRFD